eukprot:scpid30470/ scgid27165/ 
MQSSSAPTRAQASNTKFGLLFLLACAAYHTVEASRRAAPLDIGATGPDDWLSGATSSGRAFGSHAERAGKVPGTHISVESASAVDYGYTLRDSAGWSEPPYETDLACNASLIDRWEYAEAFRTLTDDESITGVVIEFSLYEPLNPCEVDRVLGGSLEECKNFTSLSRADTEQCDATMSRDFTAGKTELRGNATIAVRYFHPLQQIWSRRGKPCPILKLPPDRVALSATLLSNKHLHVEHVYIPLAVSSLACWRNLSQAQQSEITLELSLSEDAGLAAPGIQNGTAQLCQLRYASKRDFAVLNTNTEANSSNEGFAFSCCYADAPGGVVSCETSMSFSRWYDGNTIATFWGLFLAMLLAPLPLMSSLAPASKPSGEAAAAAKNTTPTDNGATGLGVGSMAGIELSAASQQPSDPEHRIALNSSMISDRTPLIAQPAEDDVFSEDFGQELSPALGMKNFTTWQILSSTLHGRLSKHFVQNTNTSPFLKEPALVVENPGCMALRNWFSKYQLPRRLRWLCTLSFPLVLVALRAIAYRLSSTNRELKCMVKVDASTPWFLFLTSTDYILLVTYFVVGAFCQLANPQELDKKLKEAPSSNAEQKSALFPVLPSGYRFPLSSQSSSTAIDGEPILPEKQSQGFVQHVVGVFKRYSLLHRIYQDRIQPQTLKTSYPWLALCTLLSIVDFALLCAIILVGCIYNTPLGYLVMRWSIAAGASVALLTSTPKLRSALKLAISAAWCVTLIAIILLTLLMGTWIITTVKFIIVGIFYNIHKYIDYLIPVASFLLYFLHFWNRLIEGYNDIQTSVIAHFHKAMNEEKLVQRIASAVATDLRSNTAPKRRVAQLKVPAEVFDQILREHYPVRFGVLKTLAMFLGACIYLAALNATVILNSELAEYSDVTKALVLIFGSVLPKVMEKLFASNDSQQQLQRDTHIEQAVRKKLTVCMATST